MDLKDFETVFHLCVVFNFVYAAVEDFSKRISLFFKFPFSSLVTHTLSKFSIKVQNIKDSETFREGKLKKLEGKLDARFVQLSSIINDFLNPKKYDLEYNLKFKSLYFTTGFFSFSLLVLSGFDHYLDEPRVYNSLFIIDCCVLAFFLYVFVSSFFKTLKAITPIYTIIMSLFFTAIYILTYANGIKALISPNKNCSITFAVVLVICPFFLHFLRVLIQLLIIYVFVGWLRLKYNIVFDEINQTVISIDRAKTLLKENGIE